MGPLYLHRAIARAGTVYLDGIEEVHVASDAVIFEAEFEEHSARNFPPALRGRPVHGQIELYISNDGDEFNESDELVAVQVPPTTDEMQAFFQGAN